MREGRPTKRFPDLGVWAHSYGPESVLPGDRLKLVIYDKDDNIVRRFEQVRGECIEDGYVDFAVDALNLPSRFLYPIVDIAPDGEQTVLKEDFSPRDDQDEYLKLLKVWAETYGVPQ
jgi:hypothetical protein